MKKPLLAAFLVVASWTASASAYTVILKDGRRLEVQENYRIVNDIAVFVLADGKRFSVSVNNVDIAKTEMANHQGIGEFVQRAGAPLPILDSDVPAVKPTPAMKDKAAVARAKTPITRTLVNADFETYKQRRGDSKKNKDTTPETPPTSEVAAATPAFQPPPIDPVLDRKSEAYWRERARPLLTEMAVQEELIGILQNQLSQLEANRGRGQTSYSTIQTPGGVVINGNGGYYNPGSTVLIPQTNTSGQDFETKVRERLMEARLNLTAVQIRYNALTEEARRAGVPPGWTRWQ
ncbi:MAG TPA: hypothetical protein PLL06_17525 [Acidobacteriota bacterium]|nr:hypothetical protein [Acidobacteriota bacterium]